MYMYCMYESGTTTRFRWAVGPQCGPQTPFHSQLTSQATQQQQPGTRFLGYVGMHPKAGEK